MAEKKKATKDRKAKVKKPGKKLGELYEVSGDSLKRKNRNCPKCFKVHVLIFNQLDTF